MPITYPLVPPVAGDYTRVGWAENATDDINDLNGRVKTYLAEYRVTAATEASVTFTVPSTLKTLQVFISARGDYAGDFANLLMRVNGDATAGRHSYALIYGASIGVTNATTSGSNSATSSYIGYIPAATSTAGLFWPNKLDVVTWYSVRNTYPSWSFLGGGAGRAAGDSPAWLTGVGDYSGAGPYTSLLFLPGSGNFVQNSQFYLTGTY